MAELTGKARLLEEVSRDLQWILGSPGLLEPEAFPDPALFLSDDFFLKELSAFSDRLRPEQLLPVLEQMGLLEEHAFSLLRAGRFFEQLAAKWIEQAYEPDAFLQNTPLKEEESGRVLGEFDFLFSSSRFPFPQHWETTVKFYLSADLPELDPHRMRSYFGTRIKDRLDLKVSRLLSHQLPLSQRPEALTFFRKQGWDAVRSRCWMKGRLFYPLLGSWRTHACPPQVSARHLRGWWISAELWEPGQFHAGSHWEILERRKWLSERTALRASPLSSSELGERLKGYFDSLPPESALHVAELRRVADGWHELSRGFIVHPSWQKRVQELSLEQPDRTDRT